jgi:hypothetical protein
MNLAEIVSDVANALVTIDASRQPFRAFKPGVGPYGEPQLVRLIAEHLNTLPKYRRTVRTKRCPDLLIPGEWAIEFKITRPYGDNGKEAENWSVNLLHPYPGNVSTLGDCYKLIQYPGQERRAVVVIGYEHAPPKIDLTPLINAFEVIAKTCKGFNLGKRIEARRDELFHPVHQSLRIFSWEVLLKSVDEQPA